MDSLLVSQALRFVNPDWCLWGKNWLGQGRRLSWAAFRGLQLRHLWNKILHNNVVWLLNEELYACANSGRSRTAAQVLNKSSLNLNYFYQLGNVTPTTPGSEWYLYVSRKLKNVIFKHSLRCWSIKIHTVWLREHLLQKKISFGHCPKRGGGLSPCGQKIQAWVTHTPPPNPGNAWILGTYRTALTP